MYDHKRRILLYGFCRSTTLLYEQLEDVILPRGGEIVSCRNEVLSSGLCERLQLTASIPKLFGVPSELQTVNEAIEVRWGGRGRVRAARRPVRA